jgi:uncharacterized cupredoxin-like copper-binding protein
MNIPSSRLLAVLNVLALVAATIAIVAGDGAAQSVTAKRVKQPFSITISTETPVVKAGSVLWIKIQLTNTCDHNINASGEVEQGVDMSYEQEVRDSKGILVKREQRKPEASIGSSHLETLKPGESANTGTFVSPEYDMSRPGKYLIQLSRPISENPNDGVVKSNVLEMTVAP